jgi:predicted nucleic acid-binding Zn ribbon protein
MAFNPLLQILETLKGKYPALGSRLKEAEALGNWEKAVGPAIAKHSKAIGVEGGILMVEVDHPIWKSELHHRKRQILDMMNAGAKTAALTDIQFLDPRTTRS